MSVVIRWRRETWGYGEVGGLKILLRRKMIGTKNKINLPVEKGDIKHHSPVSEIRE